MTGTWTEDRGVTLRMEEPSPADDPSLDPIREAIRKLPPYPFPVKGDEMQTVYVEGLKTCTTPDELREFINQWRPLWTISFHSPGEMAPEWDALVQGTYDPEAVFSAIQTLRREVETEEAREELMRLLEESPSHRIALNVLMPHAMVEMLEVTHHFGVPVNVAWIQAAGLVELF
mgnify:CR=1 FL=1